MSKLQEIVDATENYDGRTVIVRSSRELASMWFQGTLSLINGTCPVIGCDAYAEFLAIHIATTNIVFDNMLEINLK